MPKIPASALSSSLVSHTPNESFLNRVILGNCLGVLSEMESESIDLTVTSPPYDGLRDYHGYVFNFHGIASELFRVTKKGGVVVWVVGDQTIKGSETGTSFRQALFFKELGFNLHDTMIYQKFGCPFPETNRYYPSFEYMFVLCKGVPKTTSLIMDRKNIYTSAKISRPLSGERQVNGTIGLKSCDKLGIDRRVKDIGVRYNIWAIPHTDETRSYGHPATFPEQLAYDHIRTWSNPGDVVLDPMAGSGTTLIAAKKLKRNYIGIEIASEYAKIAESRVGGGIMVSQHHKRKGN